MLDKEHAAFIQGGVSVNLASCDANGLGSMIRALGCKVLGDGRVVIFLNRTPCRELLANIASGGRVASNFSQPSTHRTVQLKGRDAQITAVEPGDLQRIGRHTEEFILEVVPLGVQESIVRTLYACDPDDLAAVVFTPCAVFTQTPGPHAGEPLK
ncbi:MAG: pyridoxamine 5'-phosphate oxidase family protein [Dechloromonas sp.]|nr:pyridoxamine 5'-phosphate oxidase family protein [Dechloromonas sp.]HND00014.1 pyridoxamine 5'-phosphate oxidase family protein [Myxococcota bacterium]